MGILDMDKSNTIIDSTISKTAKLFRNTRIVNSIIGDDSTIGDDCDIVNLRMAEKTELGRRNLIRDTEIGRCSYTGTGDIIKNTEIGKFCCISWDVSIGGGNHDYQRISMYTDYWFNRNFGIPYDSNAENKKSTLIGNDVWIGAGVIINDGVSIGNGCVIGSGAVIVGDVPAWSVVVGVPGKVIKKRFDDDIIIALEKLRWWDWNDETIRKHHALLTSTPDLKKINEIIEENGV